MPAACPRPKTSIAGSPDRREGPTPPPRAAGRRRGRARSCPPRARGAAAPCVARTRSSGTFAGSFTTGRDHRGPSISGRRGFRRRGALAGPAGMVQLGGLEPPTFGATIRRSNQLSYSCTGLDGVLIGDDAGLGKPLFGVVASASPIVSGADPPERGRGGGRAPPSHRGRHSRRSETLGPPRVDPHSPDLKDTTVLARASLAGLLVSEATLPAISCSSLAWALIASNC